MKGEKLSIGKKVGCIVGISIASILIVLSFSGRFCNPDTALGFMKFANFFVGAFGIAFYGMMAAVIIACSCFLAGKTVKIPVKYIINFVLMFIAVVLLVHALTTMYLPMDFKSHMSYLYHCFDNELGVPSFGGVVFGLFAWCFTRVLTKYAFWIPITALLVWTVYMAGDFFYKYATGKLSLVAKSAKESIEPTQTTADATDKSVYAPDDPRRKAYEILFMGQQESVSPEVVSQNDASTGKFDIADKSQTKNPSRTPTRNDAEQILFGGETKQNGDGRSFFGKEEKQKNGEDEYLVKGYYPSAKKTEEKTVENNSDWKVSTAPDEQPQEQVKEQPVVQQPKYVEPTPQVVQTQPTIHTQPVTDESLDDYSDELDLTDVVVDEPIVIEEPVKEPIREPIVQQTVQQSRPVAPPQPIVENVYSEEEDEDDDEVVAITRHEEVEGGIQEVMDFVSKGEVKKAQEKVHHYLEYVVPPMELLNDVTIVEDHDDADRQSLAQAIVNKLAVFNIKIELADIIVGPSVTRYMFTVLSQKTRMSDFKQYSDDIKACVEAQEDIIIEAPVKGTNMVGIEVANKIKRPVVLRGLLDTPDFKEAKGNLVFAIGQEITGKVVLADLSEMPHLLIAGTTGSGKSVCLNCLIVSMIYRYSPEYLRFVMVDPKFVELSRYNGIPHMLTTETITTMQDALACMDYLIAEMESRYQLFRQTGVDKIGEYNKRINPKLAQKLPYLVFVVDELADLMATNKTAFEAKLMRLAQKARAAGIHIVLATQRPDTKVITGTIKANLPCRMALKVSSTYDSQTIIGGGGAEKLLGRGDMLFMNSTGTSELTRVQGAYVSNDEIRSLVQFSIEANEVYYDNSISETIFVSRKKPETNDDEEGDNGSDGGKDELYPYYKKALRYWLERNNGKASISSIQRGISVGFNRAGRIMENLQKMGYVEELASSETSRALKVLVTLEELDDLFPDVED